MQKMVFYLVLILLVSSCANMVFNSNSQSPEESAREPSSLLDEENLNISFETLMNSSNPEKSLNNYLERLKNIYLRSEAGLGDFDKNLDENAGNISFENSKNYKKLIVLWGLKHRLQDKIVFFYVKMSELLLDETADSSKRDSLKRILKNFKKKLVASNPLEKLSYDELKTLIARELKERNGARTKAIIDVDAFKASFKNDEEKISLIRKYREQFRSAGKIQQNKNDELSQEIETSAEQVQFIEQSGREPQSELKFTPSTGPNGNIMGKIFPKGVWALTYDDGPNPTYTPVILKNLEDLGIKATFFWLAEKVIKYQSIVDLAAEKGMARANHSWSHAQLPKLSQEGLNKEIIQSTKVETKSYGENVRFFRCPYGAGNSVPRIRKMIADINMIHVFWNVDTLDWQDKDPDSIVARAKKQMNANGRGVVLFHDIHPQSVIASKKLVEWSKTLKGTDNEIRWVTLPEIVDEMNGATK